MIARLARRGASTGDAGLMEQAGGAGGEQPSGPGANDEGVICLCGACGPGLVSRGTRAALGPVLGVLRPLCEVLADGPDTFTGTRKHGPELRQSRKAMPRAAAGRREAQRPAIRPSS